MKLKDLLLKQKELMGFIGIAGNGDAGDREFKSPLRFNRSSNYGVITKDLFDFIGIGRFAANADACRVITG